MLSPLFEDKRILALAKPSGIPSAEQARGTPGSLEEQVRAHFPEAPPLLLHRLDTGTSGVLLFAKDRTVYDAIRLKFKKQEIRKLYWAFCSPVSDPFPGVRLPHALCTPLAHHPKSNKRMIPLPPGKKRNHRGNPLPAETRIHAMTPGKFLDLECQRLEVQITTGVMHQIRVHLADFGFPILGDPLYGKGEDLRLGLHARSIGFELQGFEYRIEAPLEGWAPL